MVAHLLAKYAKNITDVVYWVEDSPPPTMEALYQDSLYIIEWMNALSSKKIKRNKLGLQYFYKKIISGIVVGYYWFSWVDKKII